METTEKLGVIYQKVANLLNEMIPEEWDRILLYSEIRDGYRKLFFYYYPLGNSTPIYSLKVTKQFQIDKKQFEKYEDELYDCFSELLEEFKAQEQELWTSLTYFLDNTGKMNINYKYEDISEISSVEKQEKWKAENLNI